MVTGSFGSIIGFLASGLLKDQVARASLEGRCDCQSVWPDFLDGLYTSHHWRGYALAFLLGFCSYWLCEVVVSIRRRLVLALDSTAPLARRPSRPDRPLSLLEYDSSSEPAPSKRRGRQRPAAHGR